MRASRTLVTVGLVLATLVMVGCTHTVRLLVNNPTADTLPVSVTGPKIHGRDVDSVVAPHDSAKGKITFWTSDLPTSMTVHVGKTSKSFTIDEDVDVVRTQVSIIDGQLKARGTDEVREEKEVDVMIPMGDPEEVIE
jgi:hypothetical protein